MTHSFNNGEYLCIWECFKNKTCCIKFSVRRPKRDTIQKEPCVVLCDIYKGRVQHSTSTHGSSSSFFAFGNPFMYLYIQWCIFHRLFIIEAVKFAFCINSNCILNFTCKINDEWWWAMVIWQVITSSSSLCLCSWFFVCFSFSPQIVHSVKLVSVLEQEMKGEKLS